MKEWLKNAIFYEIYPQSFKDTNADGIGDFNGIIEKLDYIKEAGFTAIWMNPCFDSPFHDAGYDVRDYYKTAERYGTNEDLKRLFNEVHKRDMHILLDLVPGHTAIDCQWFLESMKLERNKYTDRYIWTDSVWTDATGGGITGCLKGICDRNAACAVNFFSTQPALNYGFAKVTEPWQSSVDSEAAMETRKELLNIIRFWLEMGCDGFRVDMASSLVKNDYDGTAIITLWQEIFAQINKDFPNAAFVSEWGDPEKSLKAGFDMDFLLHFGPSHYNEMFHQTNPFFSSNGLGSAKEFFDFFVNCRNAVNGNGLICIPSGNHDMARISEFCDPTQIRLVFAFLMSMPGVPFVYYGDEIGMKNLKDVKPVEGGLDRTAARSPMQWDNSLNCGFSAAKSEMLYIPQDCDANRPTVEKQLKDEKSILNELKKQISVRKSHSVLQESADFELLSDDYPLVYKRINNENSVLVALNPTDTEKTVEVENLKSKEILYSYNGSALIENGKLSVPPLSATYILLK